MHLHCRDDICLFWSVMPLRRFLHRKAGQLQTRRHLAHAFAGVTKTFLYPEPGIRKGASQATQLRPHPSSTFPLHRPKPHHLQTRPQRLRQRRARHRANQLFQPCPVQSMRHAPQIAHFHQRAEHGHHNPRDPHQRPGKTFALQGLAGYEKRCRWRLAPPTPCPL